MDDGTGRRSVPRVLGVDASKRVITRGALPLGGLAGACRVERLASTPRSRSVAVGFVLVPRGLLPTRLWRTEGLEDVAPAR